MCGVDRVLKIKDFFIHQQSLYGVLLLELITKISYMVLGINASLLVIALCMWIILIRQWVIWDSLENEIKKFISEGKLDEIRDKCEQLVNSKEKYKRYNGYNGLALLELKKKNFFNVDKYANNAIEIVPNEISAYVTLIDAFITQKEPFKGHFYLLRALDNSYLNFTLCITAGKLFIITGHYDEAIKMFESASKKDFRSPLPFISIAISHYLNKNNNKAIDFIRQTRKKIDPNISAHAEITDWTKGLLAIISGDLKEAIYIFEYYKEENAFGPIFELILERININFKKEK